MTWKSCVFAVACLAGSCAAGHAQESPAPAAPAAEAAPGKGDAQDAPDKAPPATKLTSEEINAAARVDEFSIPTPGEFMAALNKEKKPDWATLMRAPIPTAFSSRSQAALNLGGLIADGYIAVEAEEPQQVKNIGKDILALTKTLGVQEGIINRGKSLTEFAEQKQWDVLKEELEATQNEVKVAMAEKEDQDLVTLVTVGGWIRGTEVISGYVAKNHTENSARLLRQPAIVAYLRERVNALPEKIRDDPAVKKVRTKLVEIEKAVSFPRDASSSPESVKQLAILTSDLVKEISIKKSK